MRLLALGLTLLSISCTPPIEDEDDDVGGTSGGTSGTSGTSGTTSGTTGGTSGTTGGTSGTTSTTGGTTDTTTPGTGDIRQLSWSLHEIESMVIVSWDQYVSADTHVEYSFDEGIWHSSPSRALESGSHEQVLVGIPYDEEVTWNLVVDGVVYPGPNATTGAYPSGLPTPTVEVSDDSRWLPEGNYLLTSINEQRGGWTGGTYWTFIIDRQGRVVWAQPAPNRHWTLFAQVAVTGDHILWDEATYWSEWDGGAASTVHRTYLDAEIDEQATPGLHHAFVQLPDETLAWGSQFHGGHESLVERHPDSADERVIWNCQDDWPGAGNCESNGLFYVESTDSFLYSFYTNNSVVEVDRDKGESLWWAGDVRGGYEFVPSDAEFEWQHGISYTDTGTLLVSSEARVTGRSRTVVWEYTVDHKAGTLNEEWMFDSGEYAQTNGDAWRLSNGNTLHLVGSAGHIKEISPWDQGGEAEVVWHVDFNGDHLLGRGEFIEDLYTLVGPQ